MDRIFPYAFPKLRIDLFLASDGGDHDGIQAHVKDLVRRIHGEAVESLPMLAFVVVSVAFLVIKETGSNDTEPGSPAPTNDVPAASEDTQGDKVLVYYFHGNTRCPTCRRIETFARDAVNTAFASQLTSGSIEWHAVNLDEEANKHFVDDYQLTTRSVVLVRMANGVRAEWKNLDRIWDLVGKENEFKQYVIAETTAYTEPE